MGVVDVASLAIGGPVAGLIGAIIGILIKTYFDARKDNREEKVSDVAVENGYLDNAKKVVDIIRGETERMEARLSSLDARATAAEERADRAERRNREQQRLLNQHEDTIADQAREMRFLRRDLDAARDEIQRLNGGSSA